MKRLMPIGLLGVGLVVASLIAMAPSAETSWMSAPAEEDGDPEEPGVANQVSSVESLSLGWKHATTIWMDVLSL
jgi:hypothetical protein